MVIHPGRFVDGPFPCVLRLDVLQAVSGPDTGKARRAGKRSGIRQQGQKDPVIRVGRKGVLQDRRGEPVRDRRRGKQGGRGNDQGYDNRDKRPPSSGSAGKGSCKIAAAIRSGTGSAGMPAGGGAGKTTASPLRPDLPGRRR